MCNILIPGICESECIWKADTAARNLQENKKKINNRMQLGKQGAKGGELIAMVAFFVVEFLWNGGNEA